MHEGSDGSSKFIFDLMEPERPKVDRAVLDFVKGMFSIQPILSFAPDGVCRLNPEMARTVVARVSMKNFQSRLVLAASHVGITSSPNRASRRFRSSPPRAGGNVALAAAPLRSRFAPACRLRDVCRGERHADAEAGKRIFQTVYHQCHAALPSLAESEPKTCRISREPTPLQAEDCDDLSRAAQQEGHRRRHRLHHRKPMSREAPRTRSNSRLRARRCLPLAHYECVRSSRLIR